MRNFLPESQYDFPPTQFEELCCGKTVTGKGIRINILSEYIEVDLGNGIIAKMPFDESTIYPQKRNGYLSPDIYSLENKVIRVKITQINPNDKTITVSRKLNMQDVLNNIKNNKIFDVAEITAYSDFSAFIDVGAGIKGRIKSFYFSPTKVKNIRDIEIPIGTIMPLMVLNYDELTMQFDLARQFSKTETLSAGQIVSAKIFNPIGDGIGYYCLIGNNICGIIDCHSMLLHYGDNVLAKVKKLTEKGPKLSFVAFNQ